MQTWGDAQGTVLVTTRQPFTSPHVIALPPSPEQLVPAPEAQAAGTGGQAQVASGRAPAQVVGAVHDVVLRDARQPLASRPHFSSLPPVQSVPAVVHSAGGAGHAPQVAVPAVPAQGCVHGVVLVTTRQPAASTAHVTTDLSLLGSQKVPALVQAAGLAGHWQAAPGKAPPHGSPDVQELMALW
jgi:hypothetical protein